MQFRPDGDGVRFEFNDAVQRPVSAARSFRKAVACVALAATALPGVAALRNYLDVASFDKDGQNVTYDVSETADGKEYHIGTRFIDPSRTTAFSHTEEVRDVSIIYNKKQNSFSIVEYFGQERVTAGFSSERKIDGPYPATSGFVHNITPEADRDGIREVGEDIARFKSAQDSAQGAGEVTTKFLAKYGSLSSALEQKKQMEQGILRGAASFVEANQGQRAQIPYGTSPIEKGPR